jgi:putative addiction module CopG family antidote
MELTLEPDVKKFIDDCVDSGEFATPQEVVSAAMRWFASNHGQVEFAPGELDRLVAEGEASGAPLPGDQVLAELRQLRDNFR